MTPIGHHKCLTNMKIIFTKLVIQKKSCLSLHFCGEAPTKNILDIYNILAPTFYHMK